MILVLGKNGQLASAFARQSFPSREVVFLGSADLDLSREGVAATRILKERPDLIINCAAFTAVDQAETDIVANQRLNAGLPAELARAAQQTGSRILHFSTDYVYGGQGANRFVEDDPKDPQNAYGKAKLAGEEALAQSGAAFHCYRISWVYSPVGKNFVKTMLRLGGEREELNVVDDQVGSPMAAEAVAAVMMRTAVPALLEKDCREREIFNLSSGPYVSWFGFAEEIFAQARGLGFPLKLKSLRGVGSHEYPTQARRPLNSRMNDKKFRARFGSTLPPWKESLQGCLQSLKPTKEGSSRGS